MTTSIDSRSRIFPFEEIICPIASNEVDWIYLIINKSRRIVTIHDSSNYSKSKQNKMTKIKKHISMLFAKYFGSLLKVTENHELTNNDKGFYDVIAYKWKKKQPIENNKDSSDKEQKSMFNINEHETNIIINNRSQLGIQTMMMMVNKLKGKECLPVTNNSEYVEFRMKLLTLIYCVHVCIVGRKYDHVKDHLEFKNDNNVPKDNYFASRECLSIGFNYGETCKFSNEQV